MLNVHVLFNCIIDNILILIVCYIYLSPAFCPFCLVNKNIFYNGAKYHTS